MTADEAQAKQVASEFAATYGAMPAGVWAAPGRVNLIGEHTDYNDGLVLPFALPLRTYVAASPRVDRLLRVRSTAEPAEVSISLDDIAPGRPAGWAAYVAGVIWALTSPLPRGDHARLVDPLHGSLPGFDLLVDGRIPLGSGLSSSHSLECAVGTAVIDLARLDLPPMELALVVQRAENEFVGAPTGLMDQVASLLGRAGHALLFDVRSREVVQVPFDPAADGLRLLVIDTMVRHSHSGGEYGERRRSCEAAAKLLGVTALRDVEDLDKALEQLTDDVLRRRMSHVVTENARVLDTADALRSRDWSRVGALMTSSHVSLRDDYEVSCPELDAAVSSALDAGALGARMTGGGFGGSAIALAPDELAENVVVEVERAFTAAGFDPPMAFTAVPSAGAARVL